jgi:hypothetical protein
VRGRACWKDTAVVQASDVGGATAKVVSNRLAQRHMYFGNDVIADRNLSFAIAQSAGERTINSRGQGKQTSGPRLLQDKLDIPFLGQPNQNHGSEGWGPEAN